MTFIDPNIIDHPIDPQTERPDDQAGMELVFICIAFALFVVSAAWLGWSDVKALLETLPR